MGIGFVLLFLLIVLCGLAVPVSLLFLLVCRWLGRRRSVQVGLKQYLLVGSLPFLMIFVGFAWFLAYALACQLRGLDPWIGDSWSVPVGGSYYFCMIDVTEHGDLLKDGCSGVPTVADVTRLVRINEMIFGEVAESTFFSLNTKTNRLERGITSNDIAMPIEAIHSFESAYQFYTTARRSKIGIIDVGAVVALLVLELALVSFTCWALVGRFRSSR